MLSMVVFTFELLADQPMPETIVELYGVATKAVIESDSRRVRRESREDLDEEPLDLVPLLTAVFCEAHSAAQLVITQKHIVAAAQTLGEVGEAPLRRFLQRVLKRTTAVIYIYNELAFLDTSRYLNKCGSRGCIKVMI